MADSVVNMCILLFCLMALVVDVETVVHWYIQTDKIVIGERLKLFCNTSAIQNACEGCSTRWFGGPAYSLLSLDGYSVDSSKYQTGVEVDGFNLVISNLTKSDLHQLYSCSYGFHTSKRNLTLEKPFELHPIKDGIRFNHTINSGSMLKVEIDILEVHPPPDCSIYLNKEDMTSKLKTHYETTGIAYRVKFELRHDIQDHSCKGKLHMKCQVGSRSHDIITTNINYSCKSNTDGLFIISISIALSSVLFVVIATILFKCIKNRHDSSRARRKENTSDRKTEDEAVAEPLVHPYNLKTFT